MMKVALLAMMLCGAAMAVTNNDVTCDSTPGVALQVTYVTGQGQKQASISLNELKTHKLEGSDMTYTVRCPTNTVYKAMRSADGQVKPGKQCEHCAPAILASGAGKVIPMTATVVQKDTIFREKTKTGEISSAESLVHARAAKIFANLEETNKRTGYFDSAFGTVSHSSEGGTPMRGGVQSGLAKVIENAWKPGATGSVTLDASSETSYTPAFAVQIKAADFGAAPQGLALSLKDAAGAEVLSAAVRAAGVESQVAIADKPRLVHKICPFVVQSNKLDLSLTAPSGSPKAILEKMLYSKTGSADADHSYPAGLDFQYSVIDLIDVAEAGFTVDEINKLPSSLSAEKRAQAIALLTDISRADASEPCLDIMSGATPVRRNWPNALDANCRDKESELDAYFATCGSTCAGCLALGTAASTPQDKKDNYSAKCPLWARGLIDQAGLQSQAGWGSDKADLAHANLYCQGNDDYKAEAETVTSAPAGYGSMSYAQCKNFGEAYTSVAGFTGAIAWGNVVAEDLAGWPKGCYIYDNKVYFNGHVTGAARSGTQRVHASWGLLYGATYRQFAGATCTKCYLNPSGRRSAEAPALPATASSAGKRETTVSIEHLDAHERGDIRHSLDHAKALAANAAYAKKGASSSRRMLSTGGAYTYTPAVTDSGAACKSNGNFALESTCGGGCTFKMNGPWCEAIGSAPWKGKAGCYDRGAHIGCKQDYCRTGTVDTFAVDDANLQETRTITTYCQDACKGFTNLPFKWTDQPGWLSKTGQAVTVAEGQASCAANGPSCLFLKLGRCFDAFGSYFAARATGILESHGLTELATDAQVDIARQKGLVCPNEKFHECGLYDLQGAFDLPPSVNATAWAEQRTCEALPLIDPSSAATVNSTLSPFTHDADVATRYGQVQKLGCLAFYQCDWSAAKGCYTMPGYEGTCLEGVKADMQCSGHTDAEKRAACEAAAARQCDNLRDEESIVRQLLPLGNKMSGERNVKGLGTKAASFMQTMQQIRDSLGSYGLEPEAVLSTKLNLAAQKTQMDACRAKLGVWSDEAVVNAATSAADHADYHTKKADADACGAKLLRYAAAKVVQQFNAATGTAGPTVASLVEDSADAYNANGRAVLQSAARFDFCTGQFANSGVASSTATFGADDDDVSDQPACLQTSLKAYADMDSSLLRIMDPVATTDKMVNQLVLVAGDYEIYHMRESSPCEQAPQAPANVSLAVTGCPAASAGRRSMRSRAFAYAFNPTNRISRRFRGRRSGSTELDPCPPGTIANGTHNGPRCWNAHTNANLYFPVGYTLTSTDCAPAPTDNSNNDGVGQSGMQICANGMQALECTTTSNGADDVIYWRDANDANQWMSSTTKCVPAQAAISDQPVNGAVSETSQVLNAIAALDATVTAQNADTRCISGGDTAAKNAIKTLHQSLGFCSQ